MTVQIGDKVFVEGEVIRVNPKTKYRPKVIEVDLGNGFLGYFPQSQIQDTTQLQKLIDKWEDQKQRNLRLKLAFSDKGLDGLLADRLSDMSTDFLSDLNSLKGE